MSLAAHGGEQRGPDSTAPPGGVNHTAPPEQLPALAWLPAREERPVAVALVVHGLNLEPTRMDALASLLRARGVAVLRVALAGHRGRSADFKRVSAELWRSELTTAYAEAAARARALDLPLYLVAFSLGALVALESTGAQVEAARAGSLAAFDRAVLLAPAIALRPRVRLIELLGALGPGFVVPSAAPEPYRANPGTTNAAYRALFDLESSLRDRGLAHAAAPTLVLIDPEDELVSYQGLRRLIADEGLARWSLIEVSNAGSDLEDKRHHLIVDAAAVGEVQWRQMTERIQRHLGLGAPRP